jgi:hypothetical protein
MGYSCPMNLEAVTRTHFTFRVDTWTPDGESIVEHVAGVEDYPVALATYQAACQRWPGTPITLRQGCASDRGQPVPAHGVGHRRRAVALDRLAVERVKTDAARSTSHTVHLVSEASLASWGFTRRSRMSRSKLFW